MRTRSCLVKRPQTAPTLFSICAREVPLAHDKRGVEAHATMLRTTVGRCWRTALGHSHNVGPGSGGGQGLCIPYAAPPFVLPCGPHRQLNPTTPCPIKLLRPAPQNAKYAQLVHRSCNKVLLMKLYVRTVFFPALHRSHYITNKTVYRAVRRTHPST